VSAAREARERLGIAAVLSPDHAATLLSGACGFPSRADALAWLDERALIHAVPGRPGLRTVVWREVLELLEGGEVQRPVPVIEGLRRATRR
jgi:hypothetical protein